MGIYCVYKTTNYQLIAFHEELKVVETYHRLLKKYHPDAPIEIGKVKRKKLKQIRHYEDLYLVRYGKTYVQCGYLEYLSIQSDEWIYDTKLCIDVLVRTMSMEGLDKKESDVLKKAVLIMDRILKEGEEYTPTLENLRNMKDEYEYYLYNHGCYDGEGG